MLLVYDHLNEYTLRTNRLSQRLSFWERRLMGIKKPNLDRLPDLSKANIISIDLETYDPDLKEKGPGSRRDDSFILGLGVATEFGSWYMPFAHDSGNDYTKEEVMSWASKELVRPNQPKTGANLLYDLDWLQEEGVDVSGPYLDIQIAEPLIDENRTSFSLDTLAKHYLGESKRIDYLKRYCEERKWRGDPRKHLRKIPGVLVKDYGIGDVEQPIAILKEQKKILESMGLYDHFRNIECRLLDLLLMMRFNGVPVNVTKAEELVKRYSLKRKLLFKELGTSDIWVSEKIAKILDSYKIEYSVTPKTKKPSITKPWLETQEHPICKKIILARKLDKFIGTFLEGQILGQQIKGRVHPQFHPMKHDDGGTVSGRFSCSNPNLQFTPNKKADPEMGPEIRSIFEPFEDEFWGRHDYSQIEVRLLAHYATGHGAEEIREEYRKDPKTDYHDAMVRKTGKTRKETKPITFGIVYGLGLNNLCARLNMSKSEGEKFLKFFFSKVPFLEETRDKAKKVAERRGYIRTIANRRQNFPFWEPADYALSKKVKYSRDKEAMIELVKEAMSDWKQFGLKKRPRSGVKRSRAYKALNALIQGSAADVMKKSMLDMLDAGIFNVATPLITVHDEMDNSYPDTKEGQEAYREVPIIMENAIKFSLPLLVESEKGPNWGYVK